MKSIAILLLAVVFSVFAQEQKRTVFGLGISISKEYREGINLIYDCEGQYFACVDLFSYELCQEKRNEAIEKKMTKLPCAALKKFDNFQACTNEHYKRMGSIIDKSFCLRRIKDVIKY